MKKTRFILALTMAFMFLTATVGQAWITRVKNWLIVDSEFTGATLTTVDINSGAIDGTTIGVTSPSTGAFLTLSATGTAASTAHIINIQPTVTLGDYKAIYIGTWGTEAEFNDGGGLFRIYGKVGSGGTTSTNIFVRTLTDSTSGVIGAQFHTDVDSTTPGPTTVSGVDAFAVLNAGGYLAASVGATDGMHAIWAKVTADVTSVANGNVCSIWVDSQMNCAVAGDEYGIFATTGGSRPDGLIGLQTTSSGYDQFIYADTTFNSGAGTCITTDSVPGTQDARIKVWYNGAQYYLPLYR